MQDIVLSFSRSFGVYVVDGFIKPNTFLRKAPYFTVGFWIVRRQTGWLAGLNHLLAIAMRSGEDHQTHCAITMNTVAEFQGLHSYIIHVI